MSRAGASYRHGDLRAACLRGARDALVPAVAAQGYRELAGHLTAGKLDASTPEAVAARVRSAVHAPAAMSHQATP